MVVTIDTAAPSKPYSPLLFGGFIEHFHRQIYGGLFEPGSPLSDKNGFRKDVIEAMKELELSVVRWPGGCFVSGYHWQDGVGKTRKPSTADPVWGVTDPNTFGTDEFVAWCRLVGCEPYICTNAGNGTPEEMKQWVEYCNATKGGYAELRKANGHPRPLNVKYMEHRQRELRLVGDRQEDAGEVGPARSRVAPTMMRSVDPDIELAAAAWLDKREWNLPLLAAAGQDLQYMAVHQYWLRTDKKTPFQRCMGFTGGPEKMITSVINVHRRGRLSGQDQDCLRRVEPPRLASPGLPAQACSQSRRYEGRRAYRAA